MIKSHLGNGRYNKNFSIIVRLARRKCIAVPKVEQYRLSESNVSDQIRSDRGHEQAPTNKTTTGIWKIRGFVGRSQLLWLYEDVGDPHPVCLWCNSLPGIVLKSSALSCSPSSHRGLIPTLTSCRRQAALSVAETPPVSDHRPPFIVISATQAFESL